MSLEDRIKGGLFGVAVGDALGGTTEFMSTGEIERQHGYVTEIIGGGVWELQPGEVTDDTMMTICVAEGILANPQQPMADIGIKFLEWYRSNPKDIGNIIRQAFRNYNGNWFEASFLADLDLGRSAGNGSLMRCLPVALVYPQLADIEAKARMQSKMTHYDELSSEACVIYCKIARRLLNGEGLVAAIHAEVGGTLYAGKIEETPDCEPSGFVVDSFRWALHILLHAASFEEVVQKAANLGGDSDTIGAIAGGLAGIYYGYEQIPRRYAERILIKEQLTDLSERIVAKRAALQGSAIE